jgi:predicted dehydrogenase
MKKIRLGIIGTGTIAQTAHLPNITKMQEFELVGVCDKEKARLNGVAEKYRIGVKEQDYQAFLSRDDIDAVIISTPTDSHLEIGLAAIEAGKHLLIEKPFTRSLSEAQQLYDASLSSNTILMVGMNHRFRLDLATMRNMIGHKELGDVYQVQAGWLNHQSSQQQWSSRKDLAGGGVMMDLGLVMMDIVLWVLGYPKVTTVSSFLHFNKTTSVEDSASCFLRLGDATAIQINVSWTATIEKPLYYIDLFGTEGSASINPLRIHKVTAGSPVNVTPVLGETGSSLFVRSYGHELRHFAGAIRGIHPPASSAEEALHRMKLVDAAYRSAELQKEISLS